MAKSEPRQPPLVKARAANPKPHAIAKPPETSATVAKPTRQTKGVLTKETAKKSVQKISAEPACNQSEMLSADLQATVGANLRAARLSATLTLQQVAAQADMTFQYVSKVEKGEKNLTLSTLNRLATVLRTDISALLRKTSA